MNKKMLEIIEAIRADRLAVMSAISGWSESQLEYHPDEAQWSASDILHHLAIVEEANNKLCGMMLKKASDESAPADQSPDESVLHQGDAFRSGLLNRERKITAPDRVKPREKIPVAESLERLRASREKTLALAESLSHYDLTNFRWPHPVLGELNLYQWLMTLGLHERRHALQIENIKSSPGFPSA